MDDAGVRRTTKLYEGVQHGYTMADMGAAHSARVPPPAYPGSVAR
jgi:hypothetical protein